MTALLVLCVLGSVCAGTVGGVFFAFSVFVMRALGQLPPEQGVAAMQRINVTVITPLFLGAFLGGVPILGAAAAVAYLSGAAGALAWLLPAFLAYTVGSVGVTLVCHVPRNNRLATLSAASPEARAYWPIYIRQWQRWNHLRCLACLLAAACCAVAIAR